MNAADGADERRDADEANEAREREIEKLIAEQRHSTTPGLDERILASAVAARAETLRSESRAAASSVSTRRLFAAAAALVALAALGIGGVAVVRAWLGRETTHDTSEVANRKPSAVTIAPGIDPPTSPIAQRDMRATADQSTDAQQNAERGSDDDEAEERPHTIYLGAPRTWSILDSVKQSPLIVKLKPTAFTKSTRTLPEGVLDANVIGVFKGDPSLLGSNVEVVWSYGDGTGSHSCLNPARTPSNDGYSTTSVERRAILTTLTPAKKPLKADGRLRFKVALGEGFSATFVRDETTNASLAGASDERIAAALRDELLSALEVDDVIVRRSAAHALGHLQGEPSDRRSGDLLVSMDTAERLVAAADDDDAQVRCSIASTVPMLPDGPAEELLFRFLFDPDPDVRQSALLLDRPQNASWVHELVELHDPWLALLFTDTVREDSAASRKFWNPEHALKALRESTRGVERAHDGAWKLSQSTPTPEIRAALADALYDSDFEVRRAAAFALGRVGDEESRQALSMIPASEDARIRAMASWARAKLGDRKGCELLAEIARGDDLRAATQAVQLGAQLDEGDAEPILEAALVDPRPMVRAFALIAGGSRARPPQQRQDYARKLGGMVKDDPSPVVRAAAGAALKRANRATLLDANEKERLEKLGYVK